MHLGKAELCHLFEQGPVSLLPGRLISFEKGQHCLTVDPPQLHRPFQLSGRVATYIQEVEETSVKRINAIAIWTIYEALNGNPLQLIIASVTYQIIDNLSRAEIALD